MYDGILNRVIYGIERGWIPDRFTRLAIRFLCRQRLVSLENQYPNKPEGHELEMGEDPLTPIAIETDSANHQHYELPPDFFEIVLGEMKKYSCCFWDAAIEDLDEAERESLRRTCSHSEIEDGMNVLDLGCGWGALSCWIAENYPSCRITAVSNSNLQRTFIQETAIRKGFADRIDVQTADINTFDTKSKFDRVVSVEMMEHVRNHRLLLNRIYSWMAPEGKMLVHVFCHQRFTYPFDSEGTDNWMGRYFFTGGIMPSETLIPQVSERWNLSRKWIWSGDHYQKTADAWLQNMDRESNTIRDIFDRHYQNDGDRWFFRWRIFFLAVSEMFAMGKGDEWKVAHYLMEPVS
jgi:cyclopropane-fatty-acyl-phospholipid synthase